MSLWLLPSGLLSLGHAEADGYALQATVRCPPVGVCRVLVPPSLSILGEGLFLLDETGAAVPFARLSSSDAPERWVEVEAFPTESRRTLRIETGGPAIGLRVSTPDGNARRAAVWTRRDDQAAWVEGPPATLGAVTRLALPDPDAAHVELRGVTPSAVTTVEAGRISALQMVSGAVEVDGEWLLLTFTEACRIRRLTLHGAPDGEVMLYDFGVKDNRLSPRFLGVFPVHDEQVAGIDVGARRLAVRMFTPEAVTGVQAWAPREVLLVRDTEEMVLYGGGGPAPQDLQSAAQELLSLPWQGAHVGPVQRRPDHVGGIEALMAPSTPIEPLRFLYARPLNGEGTRLFSIPPEVRLHTRPDLSDLRVIDADERQLPFVILDDVGEDVLEMPLVVEEVGSVSRVSMPPGENHLGAATLKLESAAQGFVRTVRVLVDGTVREEHRWSGGETLTLALPDVPSAAWRLEIDNDSNPPLPLAGRLVFPRAAVLVKASAGSRLVYGDRSVVREGPNPRIGRRQRRRLSPIDGARYDLQQVGEDALLRLEGNGLLGPMEPLLIGTDDEGETLVVRAVSVLVSIVMIGLLGRLLAAAGRPD